MKLIHAKDRLPKIVELVWVDWGPNKGAPGVYDLNINSEQRWFTVDDNMDKSEQYFNDKESEYRWHELASKYED